ncbi:MAG: DUF4272 domain-containing protein [Planctomycetes bacterium]|nr:DUF4272 domain-containing protein [Planctomycetota bacterium]
MGWFGRKKQLTPTTEEVAHRAIALCHVVSYALVIPERDRIKDPATLPPDEQARFREAAKRMRDEFWALLGTYTGALTPWERTLADTTMFDMEARQQVAASWRIEAFQVLMWALGPIDELPEWNQRARHELVDAPLYKLGPKFVTKCRLRPSRELEAARSMAEVWHWRSRTRQLIEEGRAFDPSPEMTKAGLGSFDAIVRFTAKKLKESGELAQIVDEDFAVGGKAYRDLSAEEFAVVTSITVERHFALNWLCGRSPENRWDETPTDT